MRAGVWLIACSIGCGAKTDLRDNALAGGDAQVPTHTVHGRVRVRYSPDTGPVFGPRDLSNTLIEARVADLVLTGKGWADGTFTIDHVPLGLFTLRVDDVPYEGPQLFVGVEDGVTLTMALAGRPDADRSPWTKKDVAPWTISLDNLTPLPPPNNPPSNSLLWIVSSNAGCEMAAATTSLQPAPPVGATSIVDATMFLQSSPPSCHIDATRGDHTTLLHEVVSSNGRLYRKLDLPSFTAPVNTTMSIKGTLTDVPPVSTLKIDFRGGSFLGSLGPSPSIQLSLSEHAASVYPSVSIPLASASSPGDAILTIPFPDPFPSWAKSVFVAATDGSIFITREIDWTEATTTPIAIALSAPESIRASSSRIDWSRPKYAPTGQLRYRILIVDAASGSGPTLWTTDTSVTIPVGMLVIGHQYKATVTGTWSAQAVTFSTHPLDGHITEQAGKTTDEFTR